MAGTKAGNAKGRATLLKNNPNFYKEFASKGGRVKGTKKGFAANPQLASQAGKKGLAIRYNKSIGDSNEQETETRLPSDTN